MNGVPACADPYLLQTILREHWGWTNEEQWVTSDCDAVSNIYSPHNYTTNPAQATADALLAGTDIDCGTFSSKNLPHALSLGMVTTADLKKAATRQYASLVR